MSFSILHISDIHITSEEDTIFRYVEELKRACTCRIPTGNEVFVVVSGDIANTGKKEEYEVASKLFKEIEEFIIKEKNCHINYIFVPGNHDCNFTYDSMIRKNIINNIDSCEIDEDVYKNISSIQKDYYDFIKTFNDDSTDMVSLKEFNIENNSIAFLQINSSWMSSIKENPDTIVMPKSLYKEIDNRKYDFLFTVVHHPSSWMNHDIKQEYVKYIKEKTDILFVGHEHMKEEFAIYSDEWNFEIFKGKELQNKTRFESGFYVINFFNDKTYEEFFFNLDLNKKARYYKCNDGIRKKYTKNNSIYLSVFEPNINTKEFMNDTGIPITHTAKEEVKLKDIFVWPELFEIDFKKNANRKEKISKNIFDTIIRSNITTVIGPSSSGKTSLAKMVFNKFISEDKCCLYINGADIKNTDNYEKIVKNTYINQYSEKSYGQFVTLEKSKKVVILDDVDKIQNKEIQNEFLKYVIDNFDKTIAFSSSVMNVPIVLTTRAIDDDVNISMYEILPFGNSKRHNFIFRWYYLENRYSNDDADIKIQNSENLINHFIGGNNRFISAYPINIIVALQTIDNKINIENNKSQIGYMYERLINDRIITALEDNYSNDLHRVYVSILSRIAGYILESTGKIIEKRQINEVIDNYKKDKLLELGNDRIIDVCLKANLLMKQNDDDNCYLFRYPYVYYYFAGNYLVKNYNKEVVKKAISTMCSKLYVEDYGNIILFATHFSDDATIIDYVLNNACCTLENYDCFNFDKDNKILDDIKKITDDLTTKYIGTNDDVDENNNERLKQMDNLDINSGIAKTEYGVKDEQSENYKDINELFSALKIIEVLGQILQNYSGDLDGNKKEDIIRQVYELGMKCIELVITNTGYVEKEAVVALVDNIRSNDSKITELMAIAKAKNILSELIVLATRGMIENIAKSMDNRLLETAIENTLNGGSISERLVMIENKAICAKQINVDKVINFRKELLNDNNIFAELILSSIVQTFLKYNRYELRLRDALCSEFGFDTKKVEKIEKKRIEYNYN